MWGIVQVSRRAGRHASSSSVVRAPRSAPAPRRRPAPVQVE